MTAVFSCLQKAETTRPRRRRVLEDDHLCENRSTALFTKSHAGGALENEQKDHQNERPSAGNVKDEEGENEHEGNLNGHDADLHQRMREEYLHGVHAGDQAALEKAV